MWSGGLREPSGLVWAHGLAAPIGAETPRRFTPSELLLQEVRAAMKGHGLSQAAFAARAGLSQPHLSKILRRRVPLTGKAGRRCREALAGLGRPHEASRKDLSKRVRVLQAKADPRIARALASFVDLLEAIGREDERRGGQP